jgi:hypothetical protein
MEAAEIKGHVRKLGNKLELVIWVDGRRVTRSTGLDGGQEAEAERLLEQVKAEILSAPAGAPESPAADTLQAWGGTGSRTGRPVASSNTYTRRRTSSTSCTRFSAIAR